MAVFLASLLQLLMTCGLSVLGQSNFAPIGQLPYYSGIYNAGAMKDLSVHNNTVYLVSSFSALLRYRLPDDLAQSKTTSFDSPFFLYVSQNPVSSVVILSPQRLSNNVTAELYCMTTGGNFIQVPNQCPLRSPFQTFGQLPPLSHQLTALVGYEKNPVKILNESAVVDTIQIDLGVKSLGLQDQFMYAATDNGAVFIRRDDSSPNQLGGLTNSIKMRCPLNYTLDSVSVSSVFSVFACYSSQEYMTYVFVQNMTSFRFEYTPQPTDGEYVARFPVRNIGVVALNNQFLIIGQNGTIYRCRSSTCLKTGSYDDGVEFVLSTKTCIPYLNGRNVIAHREYALIPCLNGSVVAFDPSLMRVEALFNVGGPVNQVGDIDAVKLVVSRITSPGSVAFNKDLLFYGASNGSTFIFNMPQVNAQQVAKVVDYSRCSQSQLSCGFGGAQLNCTLANYLDYNVYSLKVAPSSSASDVSSTISPTSTMLLQTPTATVVYSGKVSQGSGFVNVNRNSDAVSLYSSNSSIVYGASIGPFLFLLDKLYGVESNDSITGNKTFDYVSGGVITRINVNNASDTAQLSLNNSGFVFIDSFLYQNDGKTYLAALDITGNALFMQPGSMDLAFHFQIGHLSPQLLIDGRKQIAALTNSAIYYFGQFNVSGGSITSDNFSKYRAGSFITAQVPGPNVNSEVAPYNPINGQPQSTSFGFIQSQSKLLLLSEGVLYFIPDIIQQRTISGNLVATPVQLPFKVINFVKSGSTSDILVLTSSGPYTVPVQNFGNNQDVDSTIYTPFQLATNVTGLFQYDGQLIAHDASSNQALVTAKDKSNMSFLLKFQKNNGNFQMKGYASLGYKQIDPTLLLFTSTAEVVCFDTECLHYNGTYAQWQVQLSPGKVYNTQQLTTQSQLNDTVIELTKSMVRWFKSGAQCRMSYDLSNFMYIALTLLFV
ncbi:hypothetical protein MIR68_005166 [Amoeboaphelidium protococcarum]|nr:hypothetical protein MIR68_005166 [Amoeboaphelidium protococcarum]